MSVKIVKICFMLISLAGGTSFLRAGSLKRSQLQAKFRANKTRQRSLGPRLRFIKLSFPDHLRVRRGFRSYFYNYLDEIAMATCAAIPSNGPGLVYAVRRTCGEKPDCKHICTDKKLRHQGPKEVHNLTWDCTESLHVYKRQPALADNYDEYTDSHKLGLAVFRHHSCTVSGCGPNYCCCRAVTL